MLQYICLRLSELTNMVLCSPRKISDNNKGSKWLKFMHAKIKVQYMVYTTEVSHRKKIQNIELVWKQINVFCVDADKMVTSKLVKKH